jgi:VWFA-related protein
MRPRSRWAVLSGCAVLLACVLAVPPAALAAAVAAALAVPRDPRPPSRSAAGRIEVREVLLDALVTDARGDAVFGLGKHDFVVRENHRPVELTGVAFYDNRRRLEEADALLAKGIPIDRAPDDRYFILLFQDPRWSSPQAPPPMPTQILAGRRARQWIEEEMLPNDWVAVASYGGRLLVQQDFTHDPMLLATAIDDAVLGREDDLGPASGIFARENPSLLAGLPHGAELRDRTPALPDALQLLAGATAAIPQRKNLVLLAGDGGAGGAGGAGSRGDLERGLLDLRYDPRTMQALNTNHVALYVVDERRAAVAAPAAGPLDLLSAETGGRYLLAAGDVREALRQISRENGAYYLLSFRAAHPVGAPGFQTVEVRTTDPSLRVKVRKGYGWTPAAGDE